MTSTSVVGIAQSGVPEPLLHVTFEQDGMYRGQVEAEFEAVDYAPGEGPAYLPGPWGDCLDLTGASRFGGTLEQMDDAGGAAIVRHPQLAFPDGFTVMLWARPDAGQDAVSARALNNVGAWELLFARGRYIFLIVEGEETKRSYSVSRSRHLDEWTFVSVTVDPAAGEVRCSIGDRSDGLSDVVSHDLQALPMEAAGELQIGTFAGIRPFRGKIDNVRLYDHALESEDVAAIFDEDLRAAGGVEVYGLGMPGRIGGRFNPRKSDIIFSSRWQREGGEVFDLLEEYDVTHMLWVYGNDADWIRRVRDLGVFYQGTLNGLWGYQESGPEADAAGDTTGRQQDFDGKKVLLGHMRKWTPQQPRWTGNHHSDEFRRIFHDAADDLVEGGIDGLHVDDWEMTLSTARYGTSGFSPATLATLKKYLAENLTAQELRDLGVDDIDTFDYREYLESKYDIHSQAEYRSEFRDVALTPYFMECHMQGLRDFYSALRAHLDEVSPDKYIPVSVNNHFYRRTPDGGMRGVFAVDRLDFFIGEASMGMQDAAHFIMPCKTAEGLGIPQVMMCKPRKLGRSQAALATCYALGSWMRVPWDVYMGNDPSGQPAPRYYGTLEQWQRYYTFIDEHTDLFDGYETAATVGVLFNADEPCHGELLQLCGRLAGAQMPYALVGAAARHSRIPVDERRLRAARYVIRASPLDTFCEEDQGTIEALRASRRVQFFEDDEDVVSRLLSAGRSPLRVEGPPDVYAFLRVRTDPKPSAVIHVVNWNALDEPIDGVGSDEFEHVTLALKNPSAWGERPEITYFRPSAGGPVSLTPEMHSGYMRVTLPALRTWGIVRVEPEATGRG